MRKGSFNKISIILLSFILLLGEKSFGQTDANSLMVKKIAQLSAQKNATIGVTAIHIETGEKISFNGELPFIMGSTVKLPIAVVFLHHIDTNEVNLDKIVELNQENLVPGSGNLHKYFRDNLLKISLRKLLHHMMTKSDNTATDAVLKEIHGPQVVLERLKSMGFHHIQVNRTIMQLFIATKDIGHRGKKPFAVKKWEAIFNKIPLDKKTTAWKIFQNDIRDTTTSDDMAALLKNLYQHKLISPPNTQYLLSLMEKCETGRHRIKGMLPANVKVAHKTGTWAIYAKKFIRYPGAKNLYRFAGDVGIITLPNAKGHIAIAIYVKSTAPTNTKREQLIAQVAKEVFDYFNRDTVSQVAEDEIRSLDEVRQPDNEFSDFRYDS